MSGNTNWKKRVWKIIILLAALTSIGGACFFLWNSSVFLPHWITWENCSAQDASGQYKITLHRKKVCVVLGDDVIWTSPKDVKVQKVLSCDVDNDLQDELILLCWKKGYYGDVKPIWAEEETPEWVQHIFVYEFARNEVKPKWMSSYIGRDIVDITSKEREKHVIYLCLTDTVAETSNWVWDVWGFTRVKE